MTAPPLCGPSRVALSGGAWYPCAALVHTLVPDQYLGAVLAWSGRVRPGPAWSGSEREGVKLLCALRPH